MVQAKSKSVSITLHLPPQIETLLRQRAKTTGKGVEQIAVDILTQGLKLSNDDFCSALENAQLRKAQQVAPTQSHVLQILRKMKPILQEKYGVTQLGIFGSVARDEATDESDIDVVIAMEQPDLFTSVRIKEDLEDEFNRSVDLVQAQGQTNKYLAARIAKDAVYV
ncbi:MAG: nucleotidyltransferase family protein [Cyanobacteria bacterium J06634_5]